MITFLKNLFRKKEPIIFLDLNDTNETVLYINDGVKGFDYSCSIQVSGENNISKITNIMNIEEIKPNTIFSKFSIIKTSDRFRNSPNLQDIIELMGEEFISMTNSKFDFSYIFSLGSSIAIPASGIGVDSDTFNKIKEIIKNNYVELKTSQNINFYSNIIIDRHLNIDEHKKAGTKICGCQNKGG